MAPARCLRVDGRFAFHPTALVNLVNVVIPEDAAAGPKKTVKVPDLILELGHVLRPVLGTSGSGTHPVCPQERNFADFARANPLMQRLPRLAVSNHQAHPN